MRSKVVLSVLACSTYEPAVSRRLGVFPKVPGLTIVSYSKLFKA
jgi:hypothetical protein